MKRLFLFVLLIAFSLSLYSCVLFRDKGPSEFTVSFDTLGGNEMTAIKIAKGGQLEKPEDPIRVGYTFNGWLYDFELVEFPVTVTEDMELVASWKPNTNTPYSVRVFLQEGYECIEKTADYAELFGKLEATTGETVNVLEKAALIASTLQGYYLDVASASTLLESKISAKGDTEFRIYFTKLEADDSSLSNFSGVVSGNNFNSYNTNDTEFVKDGESVVLKLTVDALDKNVPTDKIYFEFLPNTTDWSSYDYITFDVYNASNSSLVLTWGKEDSGNPQVLCYRNRWNHYAIDLHQSKIGGFDASYELSNVEKFAINIQRTWIMQDANIQIEDGSVFYITNIVGHNYENDYTNDDNLLYVMEEETVSLSIMSPTLLAMDYFYLTSEKIAIGEIERRMAKVNIIVSASEANYHSIYLDKADKSNAIYRGYSFDVYNPNEFAINVCGTRIEPQTLKTVIVTRSNNLVYDSYGKLLICATNDESELLPEGSSYYIGNVSALPIGEKDIEYKVTVMVQNPTTGEYEDKSSEYDFGDCVAKELSEVDLSVIAESFATSNYYFDAIHEGSKYHNYEISDGYEFVLFYTYTEYVAPNYYQVSGNCQLSLNYYYVYGEEICSYRMYGINSWGDEGTKINFTEEALAAYQAAKAENPEINKIVFYVYEPTMGLVNCYGKLRLINPNGEGGAWNPVSTNLQNGFTRVTLTEDQFMKIVSGEWHLNFSCWADGHYAYFSGLYFN